LKRQAAGKAVDPLRQGSQELSFNEPFVNSKPVVTYVSLTNGSVVGASFIITNQAVDNSGSITNVYVKVDNNAFVAGGGNGLYILELTNQPPGNLTLHTYAVDNRGLFSFTNTITVMVSVPGFTEINAGNLAPVSYSSIRLGDLDGDGDLDVILTGYSYVACIYRNDGNGGFTEINPGSLTGVRTSSIDLGDIDGDGDLDLILTGSTNSTTLNGNIAKIYRNDGSGSFSEINVGQLVGVVKPSVKLGDLDGDGDLDLIFTGFTGTVRISKIYRNNGNGSFSEINAGTLTGVDNSSIDLGDIDGDGDLDLILTGNSGSGYIAKIYRNNGSGSFTEINGGELTGVAGSSIDLGDIDGDNDLDLILTGGTGSGFLAKIYRNNGSGSFTEINGGDLTGVTSSSIDLGDLDGDGDLDLILTGNPEGGGFLAKIYQNNGSGSFTEISGGDLRGVYASSVDLGDLDGDGDLDLILTGYNGPNAGKIYQNTWNKGGYSAHHNGED